MEQKRILWIATAVGVFLLFVIGGALIMYSPAKKTEPVVASLAVDQTWTNPTEESKLKEITVRADTANVYSDSVTTFDLTTIGNAVTNEAQTAPKSEIQAPAQPTVTVTQPAVKPATKPAVTATAQTAPKVTVTEYWIQASSNSERKYAEQSRSTLVASYKIESEIFTATVNGKTYYRVRVGPYKTKTEAEYWLGLIKENPTFSGSYVTQVKALR